MSLNTAGILLLQGFSVWCSLCLEFPSSRREEVVYFQLFISSPSLGLSSVSPSGLPGTPSGNGIAPSLYSLSLFMFVVIFQYTMHFIHIFYLSLCYCLASKLCPTLCDLMDCSPPGSSVHGISQARILEWLSISFSRGSSQPSNQTWVPCIAGWFFTSYGCYHIPQHLLTHYAFYLHIIFVCLFVLESKLLEGRNFCGFSILST